MGRVRGLLLEVTQVLWRGDVEGECQEEEIEGVALNEDHIVIQQGAKTLQLAGKKTTRIMIGQLGIDQLVVCNWRVSIFDEDCLLSKEGGFACINRSQEFIPGGFNRLQPISGKAHSASGTPSTSCSRTGHRPRRANPEPARPSIYFAADATSLPDWLFLRSTSGNSLKVALD